MKNINIYNAWSKLMQSVNNVKRNNNQVDWSREQAIIARLEIKLGKSEEQVNAIVSKDLLSLLALVPFSSRS
jgi:hypothetical protein